MIRPLTVAEIREALAGLPGDMTVWSFDPEWVVARPARVHRAVVARRSTNGRRNILLARQGPEALSAGLDVLLITTDDVCPTCGAFPPEPHDAVCPAWTPPTPTENDTP